MAVPGIKSIDKYKALSTVPGTQYMPNNVGFVSCNFVSYFFHATGDKMSR